MEKCSNELSYIQEKRLGDLLQEQITEEVKLLAEESFRQTLRKSSVDLSSIDTLSTAFVKCLDMKIKAFELAKKAANGD